MHQSLFGYPINLKFANLFSTYRAATRVEEPIGIFPTEKIPLGELLAPCHLGWFDSSIVNTSGYTSKYEGPTMDVD